MFTHARIKLTAWYLVMIMAVSLMFSVLIYRVLTVEIDRYGQMQRFRMERSLTEGIILPDGRMLHRLPAGIIDPELISEIKHRILTTLILVNGGILVIAGGLGYVLAGRTLEPIRNMMEEQNRFISDASHELKTPLTSLKSAFEVYLRNRRRTKPEADMIIRESVTEVDRLSVLSESLLALARYERPDRVSVFADTNLASAAKDAVKKVRPLAAQKNIEIQADIADVVVQGDHRALMQLLLILLDNAVKYSEPGTGISVSVQRGNGTARAEVKDHGIGIEAHDLPHIFDRFYRADSARVKKEWGGYGLGLAIAKKIAETHRGTIAVQSAPGKGSVFTVRLPAVKRKTAGVSPSA